MDPVKRYMLILIAVVTVILVAICFMVIYRPRPPEVKEEEKAEIKIAEEVVKAPAVALVIDDMGYNKKNLEDIKDIGVPVTLAVLPNTPYSRAVCSFADNNRLEVILHMPMEPENEEENVEKYTIGTRMDPEEVRAAIDKAFRTVPSAKGMNNHMGSKATKDKGLMTVVMAELGKRDMFFLDSRTCQETACMDAARGAGIPFAGRDIFIDNRQDSQYIREQLKKAEKIARQHGEAVAIGHDRGLTVQVLKEAVPEMKENGLRFVFLSEVVKKQ
jgi:polysaccharide deacetylase 2 family uncharacterized protein YibQ